MSKKKKNIVEFLVGVFGAFLIMSVVLYGCVHRENEAVDRIHVDVENQHEFVRKEIGIGDAGGDVVDVQNHLLSIEAFDIVEFDEDEDGYYGEQTQYYVTLFQATQGIEPTGVVDKETWEAFENPVLPTKEKIAEIKKYIAIDEGFDQDDIYYSPTFQKTAYLTFDDGPNPTYTSQIIEILQKYDAGATFFLLGKSADRFPGTVREIKKSGKNVANHTYTHIDITKASEDDIRDEIISTNDAIVRVTGQSSWCFRPPYGAIMPDVQKKISSAGFRVVMWDVDPQDWRNHGADRIADHVIKYTQNEEIILLHDGGGSRDQTVTALEKILKNMTMDGWRFLPLDCE